MKKTLVPRVLSKWLFSIVVLLGSGVITPPVWGGTDVGNGFGMVGITRGQTARLNVASYGGPDVQPCEVVFQFFDSAGNSLLRGENRVNPREAVFLDLNADTFDLRPGQRLQIRAVMRAACRSRQDIRGVVSTLEIFDNETGRTGLLLPYTQKGFDPQPDPQAAL